MVNKIIFIFKQILPLTYYSNYKTPDGNKHIAVWSQWFGKVFNVKHFDVV